MFHHLNRTNWSVYPWSNIKAELSEHLFWEDSRSFLISETNYWDSPRLSLVHPGYCCDRTLTRFKRCTLWRTLMFQRCFCYDITDHCCTNMIWGHSCTNVSPGHFWTVTGSNNGASTRVWRTPKKGSWLLPHPLQFMIHNHMMKHAWRPISTEH